MRTELDGRRTDVVLPPARVSEGAGASRSLFAGLAVTSIWIAAIAASFWSPDMITGSLHEHLPVAALGDWLYASFASGLVMLAFGRRARGASRSLWVGFTAAIAGIWLVVALVSIFAPSIVTGSDPTTIPMAAFASPVAGIVATAFASVFVSGSPDAEDRAR